jgi:enamine deaminase RidA (YjgF/YER057c/UK114 family)
MVANDLVFIAGQGGETPEGKLAPDFERQVAQAYRNLAAALAAAGARPDQVIKLTTYVVDHDQAKLAVMTQHLKTVFGNHLPTQTLVPVPRLALDGMLFEVDAIAVRTLGNAQQ